MKVTSIQRLWRRVGKVSWVFRIPQLTKLFPDAAGPLEVLHALKYIRTIDRGMVGRYCGSMEDKLMQVISTLSLTRKFPPEPQFAHVDIGVLFGGSVLGKLFALKHADYHHTIVAIDPFEGYYGKANDPITGLEVSEENFRANVTKLGFSLQQVDIIKKYSTDKTIINYLADRYKVVSLMIDGDHSYEGICSDWNNYSPLVEVGGYIIFDDYNDPAWPAVTRFINELLVSHSPNWKIIGILDTTIIMERVK